MEKELLLKYIDMIEREDVLHYLKVFTEDLIKEVYGSEVVSHE